MLDFEWFYRNTKAIVYQYLYQHMQNFFETEDIAQEAYLLALEQWDTLKDHPNPMGWLMLTIRHLSKSYYRHIYNRMESLEDSQYKDIPYEEPAYNMLVMEDFLESIYNKKENSIAKKYFLDGDNIEELSADLGVSEKNFRTRLYRMRKRLKSYIESYEKV